MCLNERQELAKIKIARVAWRRRIDSEASLTSDSSLLQVRMVIAIISPSAPKSVGGLEEMLKRSGLAHILARPICKPPQSSRRVLLEGITTIILPR